MSPVLQARVTDEQADRIRKLAEARGLTISAYLREQALKDEPVGAEAEKKRIAAA